MVQVDQLHTILNSPVSNPTIEFILFALYDNHLLAYKVETTAAFDVFNLKLQSKSNHLKNSFPDQLVLAKKEASWQDSTDFERELTILIDTWLLKHADKAKR